MIYKAEKFVYIHDDETEFSATLYVLRCRN